MIKITVEREDGSKTVYENVVEWSCWTTDEVDDVCDIYGIKVPEEDKKSFYFNIRYELVRKGFIDYECFSQTILDMADFMEFKREN